MNLEQLKEHIQKKYESQEYQGFSEGGGFESYVYYGEQQATINTLYNIGTSLGLSLQAPPNFYDEDFNGTWTGKDGFTPNEGEE